MPPAERSPSLNVSVAELTSALIKAGEVNDALDARLQHLAERLRGMEQTMRARAGMAPAVRGPVNDAYHEAQARQDIANRFLPQLQTMPAPPATWYQTITPEIDASLRKHLERSDDPDRAWHLRNEWDPLRSFRFKTPTAWQRLLGVDDLEYPSEGK